MDNELISVLVAVYNIESRLPRCLESIVSQTYPHLDVVLVDDGSTDRSGAICDDMAKSDSRFRVVHKENGGLYSARNVGFAASRGKYIMFVDGDDYLHVDAIKAALEAINGEGGPYDLAIFDRTFTLNSDEDIHAPFHPSPHFDSARSGFPASPPTPSHSTLTQKQLIANLFTHPDDALFTYMWNKLYRRETIAGIETRPFKRSQDFDFNLRVYLHAQRAVWVHRPLYFYVQWGGAATHQPETFNIYYRCITQILYSNLQEMPADKRQYRHFLLTKLYRRMVSLKNHTLGTSMESEGKRLCNEYERATRKEFLHDSQITLITKVTLLFLLHNPRLVKWVKALSKRWKPFNFLGRWFFWIK